jgi:hypothetical protein
MLDVIAALLFVSQLTFLAEPASTPTPAAPTPEPAPSATPFTDVDAEHLASLRRSIAGHEKEPAELVFENIQVHRGKPAGAILSIMDIGYRKSLGVHCSHCHNTKDWSSDEKVEKKVTREMTRMVREINDKYLAEIEGLDSEKPVVNCTTCHRGQTKPALDLDGP